MAPLRHLVCDPDAEHLLVLYYAGQCSAEEERQAMKLLVENPAERAVVDTLRGAYESMPESFEIQPLFYSLMQRVRQAPSLVSETPASMRHRSKRERKAPLTRTSMSRWRIALGATVATCIGILMLSNAPDETSVSRTGTATTHVTAVGQHATLTLPDGSRATLAPQTMLVVDPHFGQATRTITVTGEVYLEVLESQKSPFLVVAGNTATRVLGTAFTVRRYAGDHQTRVAVVHGKVVVAATTPRQPSVTLTQGLVGVVTDSTAISHPLGDSADEIAWRDGYLVFRDVPAAEMLNSLSRWYGYTFRLADGVLASQKVTARLNTKSSSATLATLGLVLDVDITVRGDTVVLAGRRKVKTPPAPDRRTAIQPILEVGR